MWRRGADETLRARFRGARAKVYRVRSTGKWTFFIEFPDGTYVFSPGNLEDQSAMDGAQRELLRWDPDRSQPGSA